MKKALYLFALIIGVIGIAIAVVIAAKAPPAEEFVGGMVYMWNGAERRAEFIKAWEIAFGAVGAGLFFGALGAILDGLDKVRAAVTGGK
jgi:hypothetical protein